MVGNPKDYHWSSYAVNAIGLQSKLCTPNFSYLGLSDSVGERSDKFRDLFVGDLAEEVVKDTRLSTQKDLILGTAEFKKQMRLLLGRRVEHKPRGQPRKKDSKGAFQ